MTLKPEDRALIERVTGNPWSDEFQTVTVTTEEFSALLEAARSEGDVSRGGSEKENSSSRGSGQHLCADAGPSPRSHGEIVWFQWNSGWRLWEQVAERYGGEEGTVAFMRVTPDGGKAVHSPDEGEGSRDEPSSSDRLPTTEGA